MVKKIVEERGTLEEVNGLISKLSYSISMFAPKANKNDPIINMFIIFWFIFVFLLIII